MITFYKPTPKNTGLAMSFQASDRDKHLYVNLLKQVNWDANTKKGSFLANKNKPGFYANIKFNQIEAGGMLDAIEHNALFSAYHSSAKYITQIKLEPSPVENPTSFVFKVLQTDTQDSTKKSSYFISLTFGEARLVRQYLIHYLHKSLVLHHRYLLHLVFRKNQ